MEVISFDIIEDEAALQKIVILLPVGLAQSGHQNKLATLRLTTRLSQELSLIT